MPVITDHHATAATRGDINWKRVASDLWNTACLGAVLAPAFTGIAFVALFVTGLLRPIQNSDILTWMQAHTAIFHGFGSHKLNGLILAESIGWLPTTAWLVRDQIDTRWWRHRP